MQGFNWRADKAHVSSLWDVEVVGVLVEFFFVGFVHEESVD